MVEVPLKRCYMWNPSAFDCECNKACKIDEYSDTKQARSHDFFKAGEFCWN